MVGLVFEEFKERKVRKVIKTDKVWGVIRTERTHVCNRCNGSMEGRPSWHWLCYSCWSELHYGRKAGHGRWYGNETPTKTDKVINGWLEKRIEIEEEYYETGNRIAVINPPNYSANNKLLKYKFDSISEAKRILINDFSFKLHSEEIIKKHYDYFGVKSLNEAIASSNINQIVLPKSKLTKLPKVKISEHHKKKDFNDMVGYYPNVPAFIQGNPLSMFNRKVFTTFTSSVDVFYNLCINLEEKKESYHKRGQKFFDFIENLTMKKINIKLNILYAAYTGDENLIIEFKINQDDWVAEKPVLYYILTNISFVRLFLLNYLSQSQDLGSEWKVGFGHKISESDLQILLKKNQESLFLSDDKVINSFFN